MKLFVVAFVLGGLFATEADASNDRGQLVAMCRSMVDAKKTGLKGDAYRAEVQKCMRDVSSYK